MSSSLPCAVKIDYTDNSFKFKDAVFTSVKITYDDGTVAPSNVITRAEPFRLQIEGYFTKDDSNRIPFAMEQHFDIKTENTIRSAEDVLKDK